MIGQIILFELKYRLKRPATYIYFAIIFLLCFGAMSWDAIQIGGGGVGQIKANAPTTIAIIMLSMTAFMMLIVSAVMGVPILREFDHRMSEIMFTTPIKKVDYLLGRFIGSFLILVLIFFGMVLGLTLGQFMPWTDADKMLPFNLYHVIHPFFVIVVPSLLFLGAIFFAGGALSRSWMMVYVQGILLFFIWAISGVLMADIENLTLAALLDPFGLKAFSVTTRYWTVDEQNTQVVGLAGLILWNKLLYVALGLGTLITTLFAFKFQVSAKGGSSKRSKQVVIQAEQPNVQIPKVKLSTGFLSQLFQIWRLGKFYFRWVGTQLPFLVIVLVGLLLVVFNSANAVSMYGTSQYPTTFEMLEGLRSFSFFFIIIIIFYTGELVWKERDIKINLIYDAMPMPSFVVMTGKVLAMIFMHITLLCVLMLTGMAMQAVQGYYQFEISVYVAVLFGDKLTWLIMYTLIGFFLQVMINQKFLGFASMILFQIATIFAFAMGLEHSLFQFAQQDLGTFSQMNNFGHFVTSFSWYDGYWMSFSLILFALSIVFSVRGAEALMKFRWKVGKLRFTKPILSFALMTVLLFSLSGCYIFYNTNYVNEYEDSDEREEARAEYEKTLKQYEALPQLRIVATKLQVDIYPEERDFIAEGYYILKNKTDKPIQEVHLDLSTSNTNVVEYVRFDAASTVKEKFEDYGYEIHAFDKALQPGDSVKMEFKTVYKTEGFGGASSSTQVVYNGTFFNNGLFPGFGYNSGAELSQDDDRKEYDLEPKERMMEQDDPRGLGMNLFGDDADRIRFDIVMSTTPSQIAIAPGYLQKEWEENGRRYFHYKMDKPMVNFYSMVSADYEIMTDTWEGEDGPVNLEIYYTLGHEYNLDRMMEGMKKALSYYTTNFGPYQYRQLRIMEFPRYQTFAQSFANTIPFSEGIGFILDIDDENKEDVDMAYYVTAHEVAHQWWGHQVTEASVKGSSMLSETMSQYSALMVMKAKFPPEVMQKFMKYELDQYLRGRTGERKKEQPLELVESQQYIHYNKGSLVMYALQDFVGEDSVNIALKRYRDAWAYREDRYVTTADLMPYFKAVTPDSLQYLIHDMFETITLYENKTEAVTYESIGSDKYRVSIEIGSIKYRADTLGKETKESSVNDWVDIGVYAEDEELGEKLIYLKKHRIEKDEMTIEVEVNEKPVKAGIDPINILIDRNPNDNVRTATEKTKV